MASSEVGQLSIALVFDSKKLDTSMSQVSTKSEQVASKLSTVFGVASKAIVADLAVKAFGASMNALKELGSSVIEAYADYEQLVGGIETLFKDSSDIVMQYANNAYKTAGLSANAYMEQATSFSARLLQGLNGDTAAAARVADVAISDMADNANKMGTALGSIQDAYQGFAKQNYTMLDNLKLGYGGTQSEMARLINDSGVLGNAIEVTAETVNEVSFDKMIEAIHVVQENMDITGTTAKEASDTIQGSVGTMQAAWQNMLVGISDDTQDFDQLIQNLVISIGNVFKNLLPRVSIALKGIGSLIGELAPIIVAEIPNLISQIMPSLLEALSSLVVSLARALPSILTSLIKSIVQTLPIIAKAITDAMPDLLNSIVESVLSIAELLTSPENLQMLIQAALDLLMGLVNAIPQVVILITERLPLIIDNIVQGLIMAIPQLIQAGITLFHAIVDAIPQILPPLLAALPKLLATLIGFLTNPETLELLLNAAIELFFAIINAVPLMLQSLIPVLPDILMTIIDFLMNPNTVMALLNAAVTLFFALVNAVPKILSSLIQSFKTLVGNLWEKIKEMFGKFADNFGTFITDIFKGAINGMLTFIENFINSPIRLLNGFIGVINEAFGWLGVNIGYIDLIALPRLQYGGVIPGDDYSGDHVLARVNSGEMVITRAQQAALWGAIESGEFGEGKTITTALSGIDQLAAAIVRDFGRDFDDNDDDALEDRTLIVQMENNIDNELDAEQVGELMLESIRRAV